MNIKEEYSSLEAINERQNDWLHQSFDGWAEY